MLPRYYLLPSNRVSKLIFFPGEVSKLTITPLPPLNAKSVTISWEEPRRFSKKKKSLGMMPLKRDSENFAKTRKNKTTDSVIILD